MNSSYVDYRQAIETVFHQTKTLEDKGVLASYIPELAKVDPQCFGVYFATPDGQGFGIGDFEQPFSIQSISKVFSLCLAYRFLGESIWERVGLEPSGNKFNSLIQLETDYGKPRNPFINAGAIVIADILLTHFQDPRTAILDFMHSLSGKHDIQYDPKIAASEKSVGYRNIAMCNYIKDLGNIDNEPSDVLDLYFDLCSIQLNCKQLSEISLFLANKGINTDTEQPVLIKSQAKRVNALMQTCGFYDEAGEFTFKVGLPGKSGVGGGIMAVHPNQYTIAVWSPKLNAKGNSYKGMRFLEAFTSLTESSIF